MKKIFLISLLATALFSACSDVEINSVEGNLIKFNDATVETTRATDITLANLNAFLVHGWSSSTENNVQIFNSTAVTRLNDKWSYQGEQYWFANRTFDFVALAPISVVCDYTNLTNIDGSFVFANNAELDLITAKYSRAIDATIDPADVEAVPFVFNHQLSRIEMVFENKFLNGAVIEITNPRIKNLTLEAEYSYADNSWTNHKGVFPLDINFAAKKGTTRIDSVVAGSPLVANHFYIIPEDISKRASFIITFTARMLQDGIEVGTYEHLVTLGDIVFENGKQYHLKASLDQTNINPEAALQPIEFTVSVTPWGEDHQSEIF
jgi:hypothetical protein